MHKTQRHRCPRQCPRQPAPNQSNEQTQRHSREQTRSRVTAQHLYSHHKLIPSRVFNQKPPSPRTRRRCHSRILISWVLPGAFYSLDVLENTFHVTRKLTLTRTADCSRPRLRTGPPLRELVVTLIKPARDWGEALQQFESFRQKWKSATGIRTSAECSRYQCTQGFSSPKLNAWYSVGYVKENESQPKGQISKQSHLRF